jgi:hypothetical protein
MPALRRRILDGRVPFEWFVRLILARLSATVVMRPGSVAGKSTKTSTAMRTWLLIALLRLYARILRKLLPTPYDDAIAASLIDEDAIEKIIREFTVITVQAQDIQRRIAAQHSQVSSEILNFDDTARLTVSVMSPCAPWLKVPPEKCQTPAMITHEEAQYFTYIGRFYEGIGRAVELGPWLGASTHHIVLGLANNPKFAGERLHVFDDFVWRKSWMDPYVRDEEKLPDHACFRHLFDKYTTRVQHLLDVRRAKIADYDGNENLPLFSWNEGPIEFLFVDCGRTIEANEAWYKPLRHAFIPGRTLIMMQDWRVHREVPRKWFNQTRFFTEAKGNSLELLHEVSEGCLAAFLFTGR